MTVTREATREARGAAAERVGRWAERLCRLRLCLTGWRVVACRYRTPLGEIDILAGRGDTLAVIEVKARPTLAAAAESVSQRQWRRLERAAALFIAHHPQWAERAVRFDLMLVPARGWPRHIPDAWRPDAWRPEAGG
jgi:putative endonuclease